MIIMGTTVSYGGNTIRYDMDKVRGDIVKVNLLPETITPTAMWDRMKMHQRMVRGEMSHGRPLQKGMVTFVISPSKEESANWTLADWRRLTEECVNELDSVDLSAKTGRKSSRHMNLKNSQYVSSLHHDSKSGVLHLHIAANRIDMDGKTNDDHKIHLRALRAAEIINARHGWEQPEEIRKEYNKEITDSILDILQKMQSFDYGEFIDRLKRRGYQVNPKYDSKNNLVNYSVMKNHSYFKASELGTGKHLTAAHLFSTWQRMHPKPVVAPVKVTPKMEKPTVATSVSKPKPIARPASHPATSGKPIEQPRSLPKFRTFSIPTSVGSFSCRIPEDVAEILQNEAVVPDGNCWTNMESVVHTAMLLFCGYLDGATAMTYSCAGGGSSPSSGWGKKDDEDDRMFARRCLLTAHNMHKPRSRSKHR